jgi:hypothetical protein
MPLACNVCVGSAMLEELDLQPLATMPLAEFAAVPLAGSAVGEAPPVISQKQQVTMSCTESAV